MAESTKQRLLVMNGQRLLQAASDRGWATQKVDKAGALKPGIYDLHRAEFADRSKTYEGTMLFADKAFVYQKVGAGFVKHTRDCFSAVPDAGATMSVRYDGDKAVVTASAVKLAKSRSR